MKMKTKQCTNPVLLFLIVAISIFAAEILIMFLLHTMTSFSLYVGAIVDASLLVIFVFPSLYFFLFRPLVLDITVQKELSEELQQSHEALQRALNGTINAMSQLTGTKDPYSKERQKRVSQLSTAIARELGLPEHQTEGIRIAGLFFDIGKIGIPTEILFKPDKMSECDYNIFKTYPQVGYDRIKDIESPWPIAQIVLQHQERLNGSGYPAGLKGEEIMLEARILAVAETVEYVVCPRPHRPALGVDKALEEISQGRGVLYDDRVVDACIKLFKEKGFKFE